MTIPLDAGITILDEYRTLLLDQKHELEETIEAAQDAVKKMNAEIASVSASMNLLDRQNGVPVTKVEIYGEKEKS